MKSNILVGLVGAVLALTIPVSKQQQMILSMQLLHLLHLTILNW
jgi:hypothetical protein